MAVYEYECNQCGRFDVRLAIGTAPENYRCPECTGQSRRVFTPPLLGNSMSPQLGALLGREEQSRDEPEVVHQLPPRPGTRPEPRPHPALARLPKS